MSEPKQKIYE